MASEPTTDPTDERPSVPGSDGADDSVSTESGPPDAAPPRKRATRKRAATSRSKTGAKAEKGVRTTVESTPAEPSDGGSDDRSPSAQGEGPADPAEPAALAAASPAENGEPAAPAGIEPVEVAEKVEEVEEVEGPETDGTPEASDDDADGGTSSATVPSFGLLFQAPEPVAPRRRRATAAAGAPPAAPEPDAVQGEGDDRATAEGAEPPVKAPRVSQEAGSAGDAEAEADDGDGEGDGGTRRSRRRGGRGRRSRGGEPPTTEDAGDSAGAEGGREPRSGDDSEPEGSETGRPGGSENDDTEDGASGSRRRRRRRRGSDGDSDEKRGARARDEVTAVKGSTRLEAKKQRRREGREAGRRRHIITEAEFLARRESVDRVMVVRERDGKTQIGVLEDGVLVEHYVSRETGASMIGNVHLGRVQNVLPSMEAAFVDIGKGRNAVLYAGEVNWDAAGLEGNVPRRIENALTSGDTVLVQVTKDPVGHKGARLTSQVSLPGRFLVYVPEASMTGISRKLPDTERARLKSILKKIVPDDAGVIVRTAAEGASEEELTADIERLTRTWEKIRTKAEKAGKRKGSTSAPLLLHGEPDLTVKVIRDVFNEDFSGLVVAGDRAWTEVSDYLEDVAPELAKRLTKWTSETDLFTHYRVDEQLAKALDRKVWLPSGGSLVIDRTEAMTVVDVNTGKFVGSGGNLEETVTKNNIEAAEELVRQLRLRDIGGIIVVDFIDMVLESNRDLVVRRLLECLGRDRTKHQVAEVTSLGLVQMTRKRVGTGLLEVFSEPCTHCSGRGVVVHTDPVDPTADDGGNGGRGRGRGRGGSGGGNGGGNGAGNGGDAKGARGAGRPADNDRPASNGPTAAQIAAAAHAAALKAVATPAQPVTDEPVTDEPVTDEPVTDEPVTDEPVTDEAMTDEAVTDQAVADQAVTDEPVTEEPVTDEAVTDEAVTEERTSQEPPVADATGDGASPATSTQDRAATEQGTVRGEGSFAPTPAAGVDPPDGAPGTDPSASTPQAEVHGDPSVARPRRKRGRVVAPAGPPGQSEVRIITGEDA
jgi:ribonuclease E